MNLAHVLQPEPANRRIAWRKGDECKAFFCLVLCHELAAGGQIGENRHFLCPRLQRLVDIQFASGVTKQFG
jgi:hypothetical protein